MKEFIKSNISSIVVLLFSIYCLFMSNVDIIITLVISSNLYFIQKRLSFLEKKIRLFREKKDDKEKNEVGVYSPL
jgi:hypothetical protein